MTELLGRNSGPTSKLVLDDQRPPSPGCGYFIARAK